MRIGITMSTSKTQYFINQAYVKYVKGAGYQPVLITQELDIDLAMSMIDGLLIPGGIDIDPIYYGYDNSSSYSVDPVRDEFERTVFHAARERGLPVFGICRGMQLIAREFLLHHPEIEEKTIYSENIGSHRQTEEQSLSRNIPQHFVRYITGKLYSTDSEELDTRPVNSMHHQALLVPEADIFKDYWGKLSITAWTQRGVRDAKKKEEQYTVCEAIRLDWEAPILAVQWHPEEMEDYTLIQNFFGNTEKVGEINNVSCKDFAC
jgi:putative glutamine amidotransferase